MYRKITILGIIPARAGSKGIKNKNIKLLLGKPLIAYTIEQALKSKLFDRLIVSTDSVKIRNIARRYGAQVPFIRPKHLARDTTPMIKVLRHAVEFLKSKDNFTPDLIVILQPTSPLRKSVHIKKALNKFISSKADCIVSLCEEKNSPYAMARLIKDKIKLFLEEGRRFVRRQDMPRIYRFNGAVYITRPQIIMSEDDILVKNTKAFIMKPEDSIDIDTQLDFMFAESILKNRFRLGKYHKEKR